MRYVDNAGLTDPRLNLALEEYLLRNVASDEPLLLFYVNEPSVIIGRNQNTLEEIDPDFVSANGIHLVRRLSGGGAVYHDLGNLNFSFVTQGKEDLHNFAKFIQPVVDVLRSLGVPAELRGRSDIFVSGKKVSGNAQYATGKRMFSHGTLLFDTDLEAMLRAINPRQIEIESKAVQSVRSFVTNIREWLPGEMTLADLRAALLEGLFAGGRIESFDLDDAAWREVQAISAARYANWEWNVGRSPESNLQKSARLPAGKVDARIQVEGGRIRSVKFFGDFSGRRDVAELEAFLSGVVYDRAALAAALADLPLGDYIGRLEVAELVDLLY
jgi:lipoate-protein ligase A